MGRKKVISEEEVENMVLPVANDVLGIAVKMLSFDRFLVNFQDGHERICRIRGKLKRRVWIRQGDIVLVSPRGFQSEKRGDIIWRYKRDQAEWLSKQQYGSGGFEKPLVEGYGKRVRIISLTPTVMSPADWIASTTMKAPCLCAMSVNDAKSCRKSFT